MNLARILISLALLAVPQMTLAQSECKFAYEDRLVESSGADFQILDLDGNPSTIKGNWTPVRSRSLNDRIRKFSRTIGRLDVCWEDDAGKTAITYCTATLLEKNRILTNFHCTNPAKSSRLTQLGFLPVEARLLMGFEDRFQTDNVDYYRVVLPARAGSPVDKADAQIFQVRGQPNRKWGETTLRVSEDFEPGEAMIIVHHPAGMVKMYSSVRCNIKDSQAQAKDNVIRHECDTAGGSSGSLLLRERDLAIVGLHHQGGLTPEDHRSFNQAIRFAYVADQMQLAVLTEEAAPKPVVTGGVCDQLFDAAKEIGQCVGWEAYLAQCANHPLAAIGQAFVANTCKSEEPQVVIADPKPTKSLQARMADSTAVQDCDRLAGSAEHMDITSGMMLQPGIAFNSINTARAVKTCKQALVEFPDQPRMLFNTARAYQSDNNYSTAVRFYRNSAELGDAAAQVNLGYILEQGLASAKDEVEAAYWYRKSAEQGHARAQDNLGIMYANGRGVAQDDFEAVRWHRAAAEQGNMFGQTNLGYMYEVGRGLGQNYAQALRWYRLAADQGYALAQSNLALMYLNGRGVSKDAPEAMRWFQKAADQGFARAQVNLGYSYEVGQGVPIDYEKSLLWYRKAADQGHGLAQGNLGLMYSNGRGVDKDEVEANRWYRKSADNGHGNGQTNLAYNLEVGRGIKKNPSEAAEYYAKAIANGSDWAIGRKASEWDLQTAKALQRIMRDAGVYDGSIDGQMGPSSKAAMRRLAKGG